ncbi:MAG: hypothetical protein RIT25_2049, partial [Planctomycetota bacterium]
DLKGDGATDGKGGLAPGKQAK